MAALINKIKYLNTTYLKFPLQDIGYFYNRLCSIKVENNGNKLILRDNNGNRTTSESCLLERSNELLV
jgi:hypothetical protein